MASTKGMWFIPLSLCLILCLASAQKIDQERQVRGQQWRHQCDIQQLTATEPTRRIKAEAGEIQIWETDNQEFRCAGVAAMRHVIEPKGLLLPSYTNAPYVTYLLQGRGVQGVIVPGCPETFESASRSESTQDQHQRVFRVEEGDVIGSPAGIVQWTYNDGVTPIVSVTLIDLTNSQNQLDLNLRSFYIAGNPPGQERGLKELAGNNVFRGFDDELIADIFNVDTETARKVRGVDEERGSIIRIEKDLELLSPGWEQKEERQKMMRFNNGLEEGFCSLSFKHKLNEPDVYSRDGGHITAINGHKFPLLQHLQLSVEGGVLYPNAIMTPYWNINAHSIMYIKRGSGRIQVAREDGQLVFDEQVQEGQLLVIPQNFVVLKKADEQEGLQWVAFKTNDNAMISPLAGRISAFRAMPVEVVMSSYGLSRDEAKRLKYGRQELSMFRPHSIDRS